MEQKQVETYEQMVARLMKPMGTPVLDLLHAAVGVGGESGEILLAVLAHDHKNLIEELGDARFYMQGAMNQFSWTVASFMERGVMRTGGLRAHDEFHIVSCDFLDLAKKSWVYGREFDFAKMEETMCRLYHVYLAVCDENGLTDSVIKDANQYKLSTGPDARYPLGYSDAAAIARADKVAEATGAAE